jgi:tetratricopeptide (TPR) repeat protein
MSPVYDIFLSYNSQDREAVQEVHEALKHRSLRPWIDFEAVIPGRVWQKEAGKGIKVCRAAAVFLGPSGIGPWEDLEMWSLLTRAAKEGIPLIPVFLPGAPMKPELPPLVENFSWVDLRSGIDENGIDRLIRGIPETKKRTTRVRKQSGQAPPKASRLPGPPSCFGRETEVRDLVETLLLPSPPPTPILGGPGAGKTTVTLAALHDARVVQRYGSRRFFVRCDGAKSRADLVGEIVRTVGLTPGPDVEGSLFQELERAPAVLVLDNAETPWESLDRAAVIELLTDLGSLPGRALVASIRGHERPWGPRWRAAIQVGPLDLPAAREAFLEKADNPKLASDPGLDLLLEEVDCLALAVVLLGHNAQVLADLAELRRQWQAQRTALLQRDQAQGRLESLEVSIELSVSGTRMKPPARRLLSVLAHLPDGVDLETVETLIPGLGSSAALVLRQVGLAFPQGSRVRVLAPVREYVRRRHPPETEDLDRAIECYLGLARSGDQVGRKGGAEIAGRLVQELGNVSSMISHGLENADPEPAIRAACDFGRFVWLSGWGSQTPVEQALDVARATGRELLQAECTEKLGDIALYRSRHDAARARYEEALPLYRNVGNVLGEANCIQRLGDIALARSDHDAARARYEEALPLYRNVGDVLGEANCIRSLGDIALARSDPETATARFEEALGLYRRIQEPYSIGCAHVRLARLAPEGSEERRSHLRAAREAWESIKRPDLVETLRNEFGELP